MPASARAVRPSLSRWSARRPRTAIVCWLTATLGLLLLATTVGADFRDDHALPGTESAEVSAALEDSDGPGSDRAGVQVVVHDAAGLGGRTADLDDLLDDLTAADGVASVGPADGSGPQVSPDGTTALVEVTLDTAAADTDSADVEHLVEIAGSYATDDLEVAVGGEPVAATQESGGAAEGLGLIAALVILVPLFGSLLAASLPVLSAVLAVGSAVGGVILVSNVVTVPTYAVPMMMLVGLGVGIDYALLVYSRFRDELLAGRDRHDAARVALATAGRSVVLAGCTVVVALLGMLVLGLGSLEGLALCVALTVLATVIASVTFLPAMLALFGARLERRVRRRDDLARTRRRPPHGDRWRRGGAAVQRRPLAALLVAGLVVGVLAAPALGMRLGFADAGTDPAGTGTREAYDLVAEGFGPGAAGPLVLLVDTDAASQVVTEVDARDDVAGVDGPFPTGAGDTADQSLLLVRAVEGPAAASTTDLVHDLREASGGRYVIGGATAAAVDFSDVVADRLWWFIGAVVVVSTLLLVAVFRSVVVPLKAAVLNLASIATALGAMTWVYGEGNLWADPGPVEAFLPVTVFAVVFGLSMDYEVFLVGRMHEEWRRCGDPDRAVREGLATTGGIITAAAAIMVVVFGSFLASPDRMLQQLGLGLAVAVLVDAVVIRCLAVPATMRLLGRSAWWLPAWLDRVLPTIELEPDASPVAPTTSGTGARRVAGNAHASGLEPDRAAGRSGQGSR